MTYDLAVWEGERPAEEDAGTAFSTRSSEPNLLPTTEPTTAARIATRSMRHFRAFPEADTARPALRVQCLGVVPAMAARPVWYWSEMTTLVIRLSL